jgi:hypothetical protein
MGTKRKYVENTEANEHISLIADFLARGYSDRAVAARLVAGGHKNLASTDGRWTPKDLKKIRAEFRLVRTTSLSIALLLGALLIAVAGVVLNGMASGLISLAVCSWLFFIAAPRALLRGRGRELRNVGIYFVAAVVVFVLVGIKGSIAKRRAETVVAAVTAFHDKHQRYPRTLVELVPEQLDKVPQPYTLSQDQFHYHAGEREATLLYWHFLTYHFYSFARNEWSIRD